MRREFSFSTIDKLTELIDGFAPSIKSSSIRSLCTLHGGNQIEIIKNQSKKLLYLFESPFNLLDIGAAAMNFAKVDSASKFTT